MENNPHWKLIDHDNHLLCVHLMHICTLQGFLIVFLSPLTNSLLHESRSDIFREDQAAESGGKITKALAVT